VDDIGHYDCIGVSEERGSGSVVAQCICEVVDSVTERRDDGGSKEARWCGRRDYNIGFKVPRY
jgi:hypothetical protein